MGNERRTRQDYMVMQVVGANIRKYRKAREMTTEQLGELVGVHRTKICCYERGDNIPNISVLVKLVTALHINWASLFHGAEDALVSDKLGRGRDGQE